MGGHRIIFLSSHLHRSRRRLRLLSSLAPPLLVPEILNHNPKPDPKPLHPQPLLQFRFQSPSAHCYHSLHPGYHFSPSRAFSATSFSSSSSLDDDGDDSAEFFSNAQESLGKPDQIPDLGVGGDGAPILPVQAVISLLDGYHDLTALPWWIIIASSTVAMRVSLIPLLVLQLKKLKTISELFPKLPPPFLPPLSGKSYIDQFLLFRKERKAIGCPSFLWLFAFFSVQVPCFFLWMTSIRRMCLDHHSGFDVGGALWFENLTQQPHGALGPIFPLLIAGLHYINVQLSFRKSSFGKTNGLLSLLAKYYKFYLDCLTPTFVVICYFLPQGSLIYWVTNSSLSAIQQLCFNHPVVRTKFGLPDKNSPTTAVNTKEMVAPETASLDSPTKWRKVPVENLSPKELLALSVQLLSKGHKDRAISLLELALEKDPGYARAMTVLGQTLLQKGMEAEATDYLERAISKLYILGHPLEPEDFDLLILASQWAGVACIRQGKNAEGLVHLERVANFTEPEDSKSKAHYYDGLVLLASALYNNGRKADASKYLRLAVAYNPAYNELLEQCENEDSFVSDLVNSRRGDY